MDPASFTVPPIVKIITFAGSPEQAFDRFTRGIGQWWPLRTHSLGKEKAASAEFESLQGGARLLEKWHTGETHVWGTVLAIERPAYLRFTWHVGRDEDAAQIIEVSFSPATEDSTTVRLVHSGWERLGQAAPSLRDSYEQGWEPVLQIFVATPSSG
jgi:uncharacterized protein YndB with AHSA1/START domain